MRIKFDAGKLRKILFDKGMNQTELSNVTGISRVTINGIMNGRSCSAETADTICSALSIDRSDAV